MNLSVENSDSIRPDMIRRTGGGWLASSPKGAGVSIGVTAATEEDSRDNFRSTYRRWLEILASGEDARQFTK